MLISKFNTDVPNLSDMIESEYSISLPDEYKLFLNKYNGGYTPKTKFKIGRISSDIKGFYGVGNVKLSLSNLNVKDWIDVGLFPIACDSFGNCITISLDPRKKGEILFCDHEMGGKTTHLCDGFNTFIKSCKSSIINDASRRSIKEREDDLIRRGKGDRITDGLRKMWQDEIDKYSGMIQEEVILT